MKPFEILMCGYANDMELKHGGPNAGMRSDFVLVRNCTGAPSTLVPPHSSFIADTVLSEGFRFSTVSKRIRVLSYTMCHRPLSGPVESNQDMYEFLSADNQCTQS